jgi:hypothetical protein
MRVVPRPGASRTSIRVDIGMITPQSGLNKLHTMVFFGHIFTFFWSIVRNTRKWALQGVSLPRNNQRPQIYELFRLPIVTHAVYLKNHHSQESTVYAESNAGRPGN